MKKRELVIGVMALSGSVAGMVTSNTANADLTCTSATTNSIQLTCVGTTSTTSFLAQGLNFSGSNGVMMNVSDSATLLQLCGSHVTGKSSYGMSTDSTVMESIAGTGTAAGSGGCA